MVVPNEKGIERAMAHGQATIKTDVKASKAIEGSVKYQ